MKTGTLLRGIATLTLLTATTALAVPVAIDRTNTNNGITDLFSATFDGALSQCSGADPSWCIFFGGKPGPTRAIVFNPAPSRVINAAPLGITPVPAPGSFLDLALNGGNTQVTLAGGTISFASLVLTIRGGTSAETVVTANGAGVVFDAAPQVATLNANGQAEFLVNLAPLTAVDFSAFTTVAFAPIGSCAGPLCGLISILTLDMVRYRLFIDYDPTFTFFTASFIGQTGNNSILSINLISNAPEIVVTDSRPPSDDLAVPFGSVNELTTATQTVTVTNAGTANLLLGTVGLADPLAAPFARTNDTCTGATVLPSATCTFNVTFTPGSIGAFSDSLDIPSNDADEPSVTVAVSGTGSTLAPNITVTDSVAPTTDGIVSFGSVAAGMQLDQTVTITNDGTANLVLGTIAMANPLLPPYSIENDTCSGQTLAPTENCTLGVRFEPTAAGATSDSFGIPSNDVSEPTVTISVNGTGTVSATPNIVVTDDTVPTTDRLVPFGNVTLGTTRDRTITVANNGNATLVIGTVAGINNPLAAPFSIFTDSCSGTSLPALVPDSPASNCAIVARYTPADTLPASDSLGIPSNDPDEPDVDVSVTGTGINQGEGGVETPAATGTDSGFMAIDPATLLLLSAAGVFGWRRRRTG